MIFLLNQMHKLMRSCQWDCFLPSPRIVGSGRNGKHLPNKTEVREAPSTPGKQVINEEMVRQWHDNSDDEESVEIMTLEETAKIPKANLPNPF